jgi:hypothetical protein
MALSGLREALVLAQVLVANLFVLAAPALVAAGLSADRSSGALEPMLLSNTPPLRMVAAKLIGRAWYLCLGAAAFALLEWAALFLYEFDLGSPAGLHLVEVLGHVTVQMLYVLAGGTLALYFTARWRSLVAALAATYGIVLLMLILDVIAQGHSYYFWIWRRAGYDTGETVLVAALTALPPAAAALLLMRVALPAAARRLVFGRRE